jgi:hypothetical protein
MGPRGGLDVLEKSLLPLMEIKLQLVGLPGRGLSALY